MRPRLRPDPRLTCSGPRSRYVSTAPSVPAGALAARTEIDASSKRIAVVLWIFAVGSLGGCAGVARPMFLQTDAVAALGRRDATTAGISAIRAEARVDQR